MKKIFFISFIFLLILQGCEKEEPKSNTENERNELQNNENINNKKPIANAGEDKSIESEQTIVFDASKSEDKDGNIISYLWSKEGVELSKEKYFTINNLSVGKHRITLTVIDDKGATDKDDIIITIISLKNEDDNKNKAPIADAGENQSIKLGDILKLDATKSMDIDGNIVSYKWSKNGVKLSSWKVYTIKKLSVGVHTFVLEVRDNDGVTTQDKVIVTVTEHKKFNVNFSYEKLGNTCNNDKNCKVTFYKAKMNNNKWERGSAISKSPYIAKEGELIYITFGNYFMIPTLLDYQHNIPKKDIVESSLSLLPSTRGTQQWIVFKVNQNINFNMKITRELSQTINAFCFYNSTISTSNKLRSSIYKLDNDLEKSYLIRKQTRNSISYDTENHKLNENLLLECHDSEELLYRGIVHLSNDEFWNFRSTFNSNRVDYKTSGSYKIDYLSDIYFHGYKYFREKGIDFTMSKRKSNEKIKSIFKDFKAEYIGEALHDYDGTKYKEVDSISEGLDHQLTFIKRRKPYLSTQDILNSISSHLFDEKYIDDYLKVNFFQDEIRVLSQNNLFNGFSGWEKFSTDDNKHSTGTIFIDKNILNITLLSNRKNEDSLSMFKVQQSLNIKRLNKSNLYFKASVMEMDGVEEKSPFGLNDCSGMAGITLAYLNDKDEVIGYTSILDLDENFMLDSNTIIRNEAQTVSNSDFGHIIKTNNLKNFRAIVLKIEDEIKNIPNINSINEINKIKIILFTSDYFTEGDKYYWGQKIVSDCTNAKAFLKVKEVGIYEVKN